jgi:hypothetical protein
LIKAGGTTLKSGFHKLNNSIWNKEELLGQWKESVTVVFLSEWYNKL